MTEVFSRSVDRPANQKPFAIAKENLMGATIVETYKKDAAFQQSMTLYKTCVLYANAYAETMLQRLLIEKPDYFEEKSISKEEMSIHLANNICLPVTKAHGRQFRETTAKIKESQHTTDAIRRLNNEGDKFHPYL